MWDEVKEHLKYMSRAYVTDDDRYRDKDFYTPFYVLLDFGCDDYIMERLMIPIFRKRYLFYKSKLSEDERLDIEKLIDLFEPYLIAQYLVGECGGIKEIIRRGDEIWETKRY